MKGVSVGRAVVAAGAQAQAKAGQMPQPGPALHQGIKALEDVAGLWSQGGHHCEVAGELSAGLEEPACSLPLCLETKECPDWELSPVTVDCGSLHQSARCPLHKSQLRGLSLPPPGARASIQFPHGGRGRQD